MIPFSRPKIDEAIIAGVVDTLRSQWHSTGAKTKLFEKELSAYYGAPATLCLNSATAGLETMLRWFGVGPGDEVILPAYTYSATANVVLHCGATPVFVDSGTDFLIDPTAVEKAITPRTKVIIPVDFAGYPADYDAIFNIVNKAKHLFNPTTTEQQSLGRMMVLADAAHSLGAVYKGRKAGTLADASVFSFHAAKNLSTAEGGAIAFNLPQPFDNAAVYTQLSIHTLHGQTVDAMAKILRGEWRYDIVEPGYKFNMTDIAAAIGLAQLPHYNSQMLPIRKAIFNYYQQRFAACPWAQLPVLSHGDTETSYHIYTLRIKGITEAQRDDIIRRVYAAGVLLNVHYKPVPGLTAYSSRGFDMQQFPMAYDSYSRELSLPVFYELTDEQMQTVADVVIAEVEKTINPS